MHSIIKRDLGLVQVSCYELIWSRETDWFYAITCIINNSLTAGGVSHDAE